ncbi:hypothetical protein [Tabrizicola sp.]|uniref:hypothetical protein n=1 Tax=Tabrizicola sp. TaxID=2005166 RepID=UPI0027349C2C|nr:hypothetical protein [Tabrizicola sp.]MDP3194253.1 hypothetical protein [Tabrizicola sp.]
MAMVEEAQAVGSIIERAVVALENRMRVRRPPEKRARIKHGQITMAQAENAKEAWLFSIRNDAPLNTFATVHWGHAPAKAADLHPVDRNGLLRDGLKAWIYRNAPGVPFAWIEVREKTRTLGEHVHLVAHVPDHLRERFAKAVDRLVARQSASVSPTAVDVRPVGPKWWERHAYLMKAGTDDVRQRYNVPDRWSRSQGTIEGARVRIAHSIGPMARKAAESGAGGVSAASHVA